jgi:Uncharacterised nucleotidyltransferase
VSEIQPHPPLDHRSERWLIHLADPGRLAPQPQRELDPRALPNLLAAAELHGVLPIVLRRLAEDSKNSSAGGAARTSVDPSILEEHRIRLAYQTGFGMMLTHHADRTMKKFAAAGIEATVIKGLTFGRRLYPEASLRTFTDVDVLLSVDHRIEAAEAMRELGFELFEFEDRKGKDYHEQKWILPAQQDIMVEVHSNLVHSPKLRGSMSLRYEDVRDAGEGNCTAATALLLVAAVHGAAGHQFDRLQHLIDVTQAARGVAGPIDVTVLSTIAERCGVTLAIAAALELAGRTFSEPRCFQLAEQLMPSALSRWPSRLLSTGLVARAQSTARARGSWRRNVFRQVLQFA